MILFTIISTHQIFSRALEAQLTQDPLARVSADMADILIIDVEDGFAGLADTRPTIALGRIDDPMYAAYALLMGAKAYVHGGATTRTLIDVVQAVAAGTYSPPEIVAELAKQGGPLGVLTPRERQVLEGIARGETNGEIAERLGIGVKTIDTHRGHLIKKLELRNNADLARFAVRYGLART